MLKFSPENAKTKLLRKIAELAKYLAGRRKIYSLDLLAGVTCPGALDCKSWVVEAGGKRTIRDGRDSLFRCFSSSTEIQHKNVHALHAHNTQIIKSARSTKQILHRLSTDLPTNLGILRYHVSGDFFTQSYLRAAYALALQHPGRLFYAYTKSLHYLDSLDCVDLSNGRILPNFLITGSRGGKHDNLIDYLGIRTAKVIMAESEAGRLPIDHDDSHAATTGGNFALLIHGVQPAGTDAAKALRALKGRGSYGRK